MPKEMTNAQFNLKIRQRVWQLRRSKSLRKKMEAEIGEGGITEEEAKEYMKRAPRLSADEVMDRREARLSS